MATRAGIDASIINRLGASEQNIFFALKAEFDSDDILIWTGTDDLIINSETYIGAGSLLTISSMEETTELASNGVVVVFQEWMQPLLTSP